MAKDSYDKGLALRKQVLGDTSVQRIIDNATDLNTDLQEHLTAFVWGDIWAREGLSLRDRSLITLAMLTALNRSTELKTHVKGALKNGVTEAELREVFLHSAAYCGFPAAMTSLRLAREVLEAQTPPTT